MAAVMAARMLFSRLGSNISNYFLKSSPQWNGLSGRGLRLASVLFDALQIRMPSLSPTMQEGTIVKWHKKEGDALVPGDILCEIQTDKAVLGFEVDEEGTLAKILKPDNTANIKIGTLIALVVEPGSDWQNVSIPVEVESSTQAPVPSAGAAAPSSTPTPSSSLAVGKQHSVSFGPAVRSLVSVYKINPAEVPATGPHRRLLKGDVLRFIDERRLKPAAVEATPLPTAAASPPPPPQMTPVAAKSSRPSAVADSASYTDIELTTMRSVIAKRLTLSKTTIPHSYNSIDCNIGKLMQLRKELMADGVKVGLNDFIIKAVAISLQKVPEVNAVYSGETARLLSNIDISVAVATDNGLITPIVKDALWLGVEEISVCVKDLAGRARAGKLRPEEFQGGSFTISNLGMFGISSFSAVINPPQTCILAVGGSQTTLDAECRPQTMLSVTLSSDARAVDDATSAKFVRCFQEVMENPELMLSHGRPVDIQKLFAK